MKKAERLNSVKEYYFSKKLREVDALRKAGKPILNLGIGSPDLAPPAKVIEVLQNASKDKAANQYQSYKGQPELREAVAGYYKRFFQVELDPEQEILPLMGSKEGIMHISMAFLNPGDQVLLPNPGYPTYSSVANLVGAELVNYELREENDWKISLKELEAMDLSKVKIMWLNYPHMPTGASADEDYFKALIQLAEEKDFLLVNDNPYAHILTEKPLSILEFDKNKTHVLELNSLSKSMNMAGWRIGMLSGGAELISTVLQVKSNMDSGMYYGIQKAAIQALGEQASWFESLNTVYAQRREKVWEIMDGLNCSYDKNAVGMFVWARCPEGQDALELCDELLYNHDVFITPGMIFGSAGERYIRISLCSNEAVLDQVIHRIKNRKK
jgi:aspartate/methionine/tyrosine aminotransferase